MSRSAGKHSQMAMEPTLMLIAALVQTTPGLADPTRLAPPASEFERTLG